MTVKDIEMHMGKSVTLLCQLCYSITHGRDRSGLMQENERNRLNNMNNQTYKHM